MMRRYPELCEPPSGLEVFQLFVICGQREDRGDLNEVTILDVASSADYDNWGFVEASDGEVAFMSRIPFQLRRVGIERFDQALQLPVLKRFIEWSSRFRPED
jgi:hypothetical protein